MNLVETFRKSLAWIDRHTVQGEGLMVSSREMAPYPEVSGYFIPTLGEWNEKERARNYGNWLTSIQKPEGYWADSTGQNEYLFDTGQIVKGLLALYLAARDSSWLPALEKACHWFVAHIHDTGEMEIPDRKGWGPSIPDAIMLYALEPIRRAGLFLKRDEWVGKSDLAIKHFLRRKDITQFTHLSHFHAYILEALCDLGEYGRAGEGMAAIAALQRADGAVPAFPRVRWVCSTGLFQYAVVWYKLGEYNRADAAFACAVRLQNASGGWFGSYGWFRKYFPKAEISWAVKYFLDAFQHKLKHAFENMAAIFPDHIDPQDGRYVLVREAIAKTRVSKVLDAGCGKGRYLRLLAQNPALELHGADLSPEVMKRIEPPIHTAQGSLLSLPYPDGSFDFVYTVEALEHAVHVDGALRELLRVVRPGGHLLIIDKDARQLGRITPLPDWEQWFDVEDLSGRLRGLGCAVEVTCNVPYEEGRRDGLFAAWLARKPA